jgi:hypothetical protein
LVASQIGSPAILDSNQFESGFALANMENRDSQGGFHGRNYRLGPEPSVKMKIRSAPLLTMMLVCTSISGQAKQNPPRPFQLREKVILNGAQVPAGLYELIWETQGSKARVTLQQDGKFVATAAGIFVNSGIKYDQDAAVLRENPDGSESLIEIRIAGLAKAIVLNSSDTVVHYPVLKR